MSTTTGNLASHASPILMKHYLKTMLNALEEKKRAETRRRNLLLAALALLLAGALALMTGCSSHIISSDAEKADSQPVNAEEIRQSYDFYNDRWFHGQLPGDVEISFEDAGPDNMATVALQENGRYRMVFSPKYITSIRVMNQTILHEDCHLLAGDGHGPRWQACMEDLSSRGAFNEIWIDRGDQ